MTTTATPPSLSRTIEVETPERVDLGFELADLGSRFLALVLDALILFGSIATIAVFGLWAAGELHLSPNLRGWGGALWMLLLFVVLWGYFVYFEAFRGGRTPGKKFTGVRVVHDGGYPLTFRGAAIRNLVRIVDVQPAITCVVGGAIMMFSSRTRRLGDFAADTLVVRDRGVGDLPEEELWTVDRRAAGRPALTDEQFEALDRFLDRAAELDAGARDRLTGRLSEALAEALAARRPAAATSPIERLRDLHAAERRARVATGGATSIGSPQAVALVRASGGRWLEYRDLVRRAQKHGLASFDDEALERFAAEYRQVAADLARARTYGASLPLLFSLERWVGAGHNLLYRPSARSWAALRDWLTRGFPVLVRARRRWVAAAAALLFVPAVASYVAVRVDPVLARDLMPREMIVRAETANDRVAAGGGYVDVPDVFMPVMSSRLISNNVQVTFFAFAGGILAGLGTAAVLVMNGVMLGSVIALFHNQGAAPIVLEFVVPHGVIELTAICIAGTAGLLLGSAIVAPGRLTRAEALADRAREAVSLLAGTTLFLVLAGGIEGFVSPSHIPIAAKALIAGSVALGLFAYLAFGGRGAPAPDADPPTRRVDPDPAD